MEIRQSVQRVPTRPIVFVIAFLAVLALVLTARFAMAPRASSQTVLDDRPLLKIGFTATDPYSPHDPINAPEASTGDPYSPRGK